MTPIIFGGLAYHWCLCKEDLIIYIYAKLVLGHLQWSKLRVSDRVLNPSAPDSPLQIASADHPPNPCCLAKSLCTTLQTKPSHSAPKLRYSEQHRSHCRNLVAQKARSNPHNAIWNVSSLSLSVTHGLNPTAVIVRSCCDVTKRAYPLSAHLAVMLTRGEGEPSIWLTAWMIRWFRPRKMSSRGTRACDCEVVSSCESVVILQPPHLVLQRSLDLLLEIHLALVLIHRIHRVPAMYYGLSCIHLCRSEEDCRGEPMLPSALRLNSCSVSRNESFVPTY